VVLCKKRHGTADRVKKKAELLSAIARRTRRTRQVLVLLVIKKKVFIVTFDLLCVGGSW